MYKHDKVVKKLPTPILRIHDINPRKRTIEQNECHSVEWETWFSANSLGTGFEQPHPTPYLPPNW